MNKRILILEDESIIADDLTMLLERHHFDVVGPVDNGEAAILMLETENVDLALLDINVRGTKNGIDVAQHLKKLEGVPFIFITSYYDEETLKAVESVRPQAYIVKPFRQEEVLLNVRLALKKEHHLKTKKKVVAKVLIRDAGLLKPIDPTVIMYLKGESNYTKIVLADNTDFILSHTLRVIEEKLPDDQFCRVHKSYIINFNYIELIEGNSVQIAGQSIPIGRSYREAMFEKMEVL